MVESESNETVNLDWAIQYLKNKCIEEQDYLNQTKHFFDKEYKFDFKEIIKMIVLSDILINELLLV